MSYKLIRVSHLRREKNDYDTDALRPKADFSWRMAGPMSNYGGATVVTIGSGDRFSTGVAVCRSNETFEKSYGTNVATARAVRGLKKGNIITLPEAKLSINELHLIVSSINPKYLVHIEPREELGPEGDGE